MGFDSCLAPFRGLVGNFKSLLTTEHFGSQYELLYTEISVQTLRLRLWGQLVGLNLDEDDSDGINNAIINRSDIKPVVIQSITAISFLMSEIKELQQKYQPRKFSLPASDVKSSPSAQGLRTLSIIRSNSLRQRMRANQKEKSVISIAKWAIRDAKKLGEKLRRLKALIDGLEDIGILATSISQSMESSTRVVEETPPPYSFAAARVTSLGGPQVVGIPPPTRTARLSDNSISDLLEHHAVMRRYLAALPVGDDRPAARAREKLGQLNEPQFKELRLDTFDELCRRQQFETPPPQWLPDITSYHPKRNEARRKLSTLVNTRFGHLVFDIVFELERRFPQLQDTISQPPSPITPLDTRRWGYIDRRPPPPLQDRPAYQRSASSSSTSSSSVNCYRASHIETFKSLRVSTDNNTAQVLLAALQKYNISGPWDRYDLYITYGNGERRLEQDERPLLLVKQLERDGKHPMFMLRKNTPEGSTAAAEPGESYVMGGVS